MDTVRKFAALAATLLVSCTAPGTGGGESGDFVLVGDVQQVMAHIIDPAADEYWDAVGWIIDFEGTHEIVPQTDEEWETAVSAAYTVAEAGNLLLMNGRAMDDRTWKQMSRAMIEAGRRAIAAAEARDTLGVFDAGAEIYYSCTACHAIYAVETLRPNVE